MDPVEPALSSGPLLLIALAAVVVLLLLIIRFKVHAFLALVLVSLLTALAARVPLEDLISTLTSGFGSTLASVALLVGLGAMLGRLLEVSGGAQVLADSLVRRFGEKRAPLALGVAALLFGFPIFFDAGLVVFLPIVFTTARRLGGSLLTYGIPVAGAFSVMHAFVPPHPGPVAASELLGADVGLVLLLGLVVAIPTWFVGGYLFGLFTGRRFSIPVPATLGEKAAVGAGGSSTTGSSATGSSATGSSATGASTRSAGGTAAGEPVVSGTAPTATGSSGADAGDEPVRTGSAPAFGTVVGLLLLPLLLIFLNTGSDALVAAGALEEDGAVPRVAAVVGATPVALLVSVLVACYVLGTRRGLRGSEVETTVNSALGPVAAIILITGAGGMFGGVLRASGIGQALADALSDTGLPVIVAGFVISAALRVAQGSATVALTTTAGLLAPVILAQDLSSWDRACTVLAIAGGSIVLSHVNDSGFWLVSRFFGMDEATTFKTWTVMETILGTLGFVLALLLSLLA